MDAFDFKRLALALSGVLVISYLLCVGYGLVVTESWQMHQAWERLLPGFTWLSWPSFFLGLGETFFYAWFLAILFVPIYNALHAKKSHL